MANQIQVTIPQVLDLLDQGKTRDEIAEHFNVNRGAVNDLFKHPELKGLKPRRLPVFVIVDAPVEPAQDEAPQAAVETSAPAEPVVDEPVMETVEESEALPWDN